jgi:uncharacterized membrane protein YccC
MSNPQVSKEEAEPSRAEMFSALFAQLVMQQANLAMMMMGKVPRPDTGEAVKDIDAAKLFIDTIEMLEAKTQGNLSKEEAALLKQSLMSVRLSFVEAVESPAPPPAQPAGHPGAPQTEPATGAAPAPEEHRTKFSKKY